MKKRWTKEELLLSLDLYKKLTAKNASLGAANEDIERMAAQMGRTPGSISLRMLNFRYLDPDKAGGLENGGSDCKNIWNVYGQNDEKLQEALKEIPSAIYNDAKNNDTKQSNKEDAENKPAISLTGEQANKIVVMLSIAMHQDLGDLYPVLISIGELPLNSGIKLESLIKLSIQVQNLPKIDITSLKDTLEKVVGATESGYILKVLSIFDKRFRN